MACHVIYERIITIVVIFRIVLNLLILIIAVKKHLSNFNGAFFKNSKFMYAKLFKKGEKLEKNLAVSCLMHSSATYIKEENCEGRKIITRQSYFIVFMQVYFCKIAI